MSIAGRLLTAEEFLPEVLSFGHSAFRAEKQLVYLEDEGVEHYLRWQADDVQPPTTVPELAVWFDAVRAHTNDGQRIGRLRIHTDPPTTYQRYLQWMSPWNTAAGEHVYYLNRAAAERVGLLDDPTTDWWLLDAGTDNARLIVTTFDDDGRRIRDELVTDPMAIRRAEAWRERAIIYGVLDHRGVVT